MNAVETRRWIQSTASRVSIAAIVVLIGVVIVQQLKMRQQDANYRALHARAMQLLAERDDLTRRAENGVADAPAAGQIPPSDGLYHPIPPADISSKPPERGPIVTWPENDRWLSRRPGEEVPHNWSKQWFNGQRFYIVPLQSDSQLATAQSRAHRAEPMVRPAR